jgi:hypothetical protein
MPPQQPDRLLDLIDDSLNFGAHRRQSNPAYSKYCVPGIRWQGRFNRDNAAAQ